MSDNKYIITNFAIAEECEKDIAYVMWANLSKTQYKLEIFLIDKEVESTNKPKLIKTVNDIIPDEDYFFHGAFLERYLKEHREVKCLKGKTNVYHSDNMIIYYPLRFFTIMDFYNLFITGHFQDLSTVFAWCFDRSDWDRLMQDYNFGETNKYAIERND